VGFELCAFLGRYSDLRAWEDRLECATACELSGELGLVPVTGRLIHELRGRLGELEAARLDAAQKVRTWPSPSHEAAVAQWARDASRDTVTAYIDIGEFGNQSHDEARLWSNGREVFANGTVERVLAHFRDKAGIRTDARPSDLEWFRGETAAEKWEAAARVKRQGGA
jgi:hypothetical protein